MPEPNKVVVHYEPGWVLLASPPQRNGEVFSFYVPPRPGGARLVVEAVGTWEVTWPDLVVGEVEPCSSMTPIGESSTVTGIVSVRGDCDDLIVTGCDSSSEVDADGSFVLLDATPGHCELSVGNGSRGERRCTAPTALDVTPGESTVELSIDCRDALGACPDYSRAWFCESWIVTSLELSAMAKTSRALVNAPSELRTRLMASTTELVRSSRDHCPWTAHVFDRVARDLELDLDAAGESPDPP